MKKLVIKNKLKSESSVGSVPSIGVFLLLCVYPFAFSRGYKDITYTRFMFFCLVSIVVFEICAIRLLSKTSSVEAVVRKWFSTSTATDKAFLCFFVSALAAFVFSEYKYAAVLGDLGRYMGFLIFFAIFLMYLWVSRFYILTERDMRFFCIVCIGIAVFSFLQFEGVDLFGLIKSMPFEKRRNFLSPFGNINVFASFLSIASPFAMYMFCFNGKSEKSKLFYGAVCAANFVSALTSNSDSVYIMLAAVFVALFILCCKNPEAFVRFFLLCVVFFGASIFFTVIFYMVKSTRGLSALTSFYVNSILPFVGIGISFVEYTVLSKNTPTANTLNKVRKIAIALVVIVIFATLGSIIYFSAFNTTANLGMFTRYFRFNDSWGTERGYVWTRIMRTFADGSLKEKLFGFGEDTLAAVLVERYLPEMRSQLGYLFDNAHNEYLHYLITMGLFGLGSYLAILFSTVLSHKKRKLNILQKALILSVFGYMVQSGVNIIQPISTPFVFIAVALISCRCEDKNSTIVNTKTTFDYLGKEVEKHEIV